jgi:hypothetical protein
MTTTTAAARELGVANAGWLGTEVTRRAQINKLVSPIVVDISGEETTLGGPAREKVGQLSGRATFLLNSGSMSDGTPDRLM